jgi:hypothetical protein
MYILIHGDYYFQPLIMVGIVVLKNLPTIVDSDGRLGNWIIGVRINHCPIVIFVCNKRKQMLPIMSIVARGPHGNI